MTKIDWPYVRLEQITTKIGSGATPRGGKEAYKDDGISLIRSLNVYDFEFSYNDLAFIDEKQAEGLSNVRVESGDVLLNITGASVARCCMVPESVLPARVNQHVAIIRVNRADALPQFTQYCLTNPQYKKHLLSLAQGGATREALTKQTIENFEIPLPPLPTQRRIAHVLSAYDDLIEVNQQRIDALEAAAQALYREWFVEMRFPGWQDAEWKGSPLGEIPVGWEIRHLSELVDTQYGYTESAKEESIGPKFVRGTDINKTTYIKWEDVPYCPISKADLDKFKLRFGDILVVRMANPGKTGIIETSEINAVFASYLIRLTLKSNKLTPYHLFYFLNSHRYQGYITGASTGTTRKSASAGVITDIDLVLPPNEILQDFENHVADLRKQLNALLSQNAILRETRDLLLPRLISGEVSVEGLPLPEEVAQ